MSSDGVEAGLSVAIDDRDPRRAQLLERRDAAAEIAVRARAVRHPDAVLGEKRDLLGVGMDAVRRHQVGAEQPRGGEQPDPGLAGRRHEQVGEGLQSPAAGDEPVALGGALGEVGRLRQARARRRRGTPRRVHVYGA